MLSLDTSTGHGRTRAGHRTARTPNASLRLASDVGLPPLTRGSRAPIFRRDDRVRRQRWTRTFVIRPTDLCRTDAADCRVANVRRYRARSRQKLRGVCWCADTGEGPRLLVSDRCWIPLPVIDPQTVGWRNVLLSTLVNTTSNGMWNEIKKKIIITNQILAATCRRKSRGKKSFYISRFHSKNRTKTKIVRSPFEHE